MGGKQNDLLLCMDDAQRQGMSTRFNADRSLTSLMLCKRTSGRWRQECECNCNVMISFKNTISHL